MKAAWFMSSLVVLLAMASPGSSQLRQPSNDDLRDELTKRVGQYNTFLSARDFDNVWNLLGPGLRKDNPKEQYVERLKTKIGKWEVTSNPEVSISGETTTRTKRPIGQVVSKVNVRTPAGQLVPINHQTTWLWFNDRGTRPAWYLAQERIEEQHSTSR